MTGATPEAGVSKAHAHTVVAPAIDYWKHTIEVKKGSQVE
jgi:hypothetical protein